MRSGEVREGYLAFSESDIVNFVVLLVFVANCVVRLVIVVKFVVRLVFVVNFVIRLVIVFLMFSLGWSLLLMLLLVVFCC